MIPTDDEVLARAQEIFGIGYACWPNCRPSRVAAVAKLAYEDGELCRLDYYAIASALMLLVATAPRGKAHEWPPRTPAEFARGLSQVVKETWTRFVKAVRDGDKLLLSH